MGYLVHMLADCLTKHMTPDLLMKVLSDCKYAFKYSSEIENVKKQAKADRALKRAHSGDNSIKKHSTKIVHYTWLCTGWYDSSCCCSTSVSPSTCLSMQAHDELYGAASTSVASGCWIQHQVKLFRPFLLQCMIPVRQTGCPQ